ncbi:MAG: hypothetical protein KME60_21535 [Cyanomargarita calcarea GSE-NOS-MK-12-04C]|jgi:hypothetical protein|uniref:Uncharacterized protein n=1 Tax=Cyanomargarita calcarea GSE-NOS-MK-12-04C TaxID=2839659 RepID=A0A951QPX3_9CYAN|nr:hypothetical protein [Cyanomargarita calcarea GSE-NOS-MK-12-04C]
MSDKPKPDIGNKPLPPFRGYTGYVQDVYDANRYINLETGEVRHLNRLGRLNLPILWLLIIAAVLYIDNQSRNGSAPTPKQVVEDARNFINIQNQNKSPKKDQNEPILRYVR